MRKNITQKLFFINLNLSDHIILCSLKLAKTNNIKEKKQIDQATNKLLLNYPKE